MSQFNLFSTENINTYHKFKLEEGNLYMNNARVGIEEFYSGKNLDFSNNVFQLSDTINISGDLFIDNDAHINGAIYANQLDLLEFNMYNPSFIKSLTSTDISTSKLTDASGDLTIQTRQHLMIHSNNDISMTSNKEIHVLTKDVITIDSSFIDMSAIYFKFNNIEIKKNHSQTISNEQVTGEYMFVDNIVVRNRIVLPPNVEEGTTIEGDFTVTNTLTSGGRLVANGLNDFTGKNTLIGNTFIDNGTFEDISISKLTITSDCDVFLSNNNVFRITDGNELNVVTIYDWQHDLNRNIYYNSGNVIIGNISQPFDSSLNVYGPAFVKEDLKVAESIYVEGDVFIKGIIHASNSVIPSTLSDIRLKKNINTLEKGLDIIRQLKPKIYDKNIGTSYIKESGVIAQDILEIVDLSYIVVQNPRTTMYGINYNSLFMYSLLGVKELDAKLDSLNDKIDALTESVNQRMAIIDQKLNLLYRRR